MTDSQTKEPEKGHYLGECNRTGCSNIGATWYNTSTRMHYCYECAIKINKLNHPDHVCSQIYE